MMMPPGLLSSRGMPLRKGLKLYLHSSRSLITRAAGMATQHTRLNSEYLSHAGNAALRGAAAGWWRAGFFRRDAIVAVTITSSSVANPTVILTASVHGLVTGDTISISGHAGSTPDINGAHTVTVLTTTTFTIPVNVTVGGTGGTMTQTNAVLVLQSCLSGNDGYVLRLNSTPQLVLVAGDGAATATALEGTAISNNTDYFFYAEYTGTQIRLSVNNGAFGTASLASYSPGTAGWNIGATPTPSDYFGGRLSAFYGNDGNLTAAQITTLYNSGTGLAYDQALGAGIPLTGTAAFAYELNEPSGTRVDLVNAYNLTDNNTVTTAAGVIQNAVEQWNDISGLNNHASQSTQANKPVWRTNVQGGNPGIRFDGVNDALATLNNIGITGDVAATLFLVLKPDATTREECPFGFGSTTGLDSFAVFGSGAFGGGAVGKYQFAGADSNNFNSEATVSTAAHILTVRKTPGAINTTTTIAKDGATAADAGLSSTGTLNIPASTAKIGEWNDGSYDYDGDILAVILYDRALSPSERRKVERWLAREFSIALAA